MGKKDPAKVLENKYKDYLNRRSSSFKIPKEILEELNILETEDCVEVPHLPLSPNGYPMYKGTTVIRYLRDNSIRKKKRKTTSCHKCNNKKCINPKHLYHGTKRDNWVDFVRSRKIFDYDLFFNVPSYDFKSLERKLRQDKAPKIGGCEVIKIIKKSTKLDTP
jgi:hypothetical protein